MTMGNSITMFKFNYNGKFKPLVLGLQLVNLATSSLFYSSSYIAAPTMTIYNYNYNGNYNIQLQLQLQCKT